MPPELLLLAQICTKSFVGLQRYPTHPSWFRDGPGEREGGRGGEMEGGEGRGGNPGMPKSRVGKPNYKSEKAVTCEINIVLINRNHC